MRRGAILAAMACASLAAPVAAQQQAIAPTEQSRVEQKQVKRMREAVARGTLYERVRSRGQQAKPKRRPNRNHIGKRVRRKHRRAA